MCTKKKKLIVRVVVADDSALFRSSLVQALSSLTNIEVAGEVSDPFEERDKIYELEPDVLVMNIDVPGQDDDRFLRQLIQQYQFPCIIVSDTTSEEEALKAGAVDFIRKSGASVDFKTFYTILGTKIILTAGKPVPAVNKLSTPAEEKSDALAAEAAPRPVKIEPVFPSHTDVEGLAQKAAEGVVVALGASTGGTDALECVLRAFPEDMPPVLVVQHMPPTFTKIYSERLDKSCSIAVKEAEDGDRLRAGLCLVAAGGLQMELKKDIKGYYVKCYKGEKVSGHCPSVDVMFSSVAEVAEEKGIGALMTGMGADGARGLLKMREKGGYTICQDKESCVVYGMPMEACKLGACMEQQSLANIGRTLCRRITEGW